jgi:hypothetical protein
MVNPSDYLPSFKSIAATMRFSPPNNSGVSVNATTAECILPVIRVGYDLPAGGHFGIYRWNRSVIPLLLWKGHPNAAST